MRKLVKQHPDDHEAAAFYAMSLLQAEPENDKAFATRMKAADVLEKLFAEEPNHPGVAHYLIHAYDKPQLAERGLLAARRYAMIAPAAPHAVHMPSHIFARLGLWPEDIESNLASIAATQKMAEHNGDEGHQFHAMDFLVYAYLQSGREAEVQRLLEGLKAMPPMKDMYGMDYDPRISAMVWYPAIYILEMHQWKEAASLPDVPGAQLGDPSIIYRARAIGAARNGDVALARKNIEQIETLRKTLLAQDKKDVAVVVEQDRKVATAWLAHAEGQDQESTATLRTLADKEDQDGKEPAEIPLREMLADLLLDMNRPEQALVEYQIDLKLNPNRFDGLYGAGRAAEIANQPGKATAYYQQLLKTCAGGNSSRPEFAHVQGFLSTVATQN
jgi:tetratricopeptide (TPR) repeat protein